MRSRTRAALTGSLAALVLLAGCGDDGGSKADREDRAITDATVPVPSGALGALRSAVARAGTESARFTLTFDMSDVPGAEHLEAMGGFGGKGAFSGTNSQMSMTVAGESIDIVTTPEWTYERFPGSDGWVKVAGAGAAAQSGSLDPKALLESLGATGAKVLDGGKGEIDGKEYDRLTATVDLGDLMAKNLEDLGQRDAIDQTQFRQMTSMLNGLDVTVWVDSSAGLVRRLTVDMGSALGNMRQTIDYTDWGDESIRVEPPADAREVTLSELVEAAGRIGGK